MLESLGREARMNSAGIACQFAPGSALVQRINPQGASADLAA